MPSHPALDGALDAKKSREDSGSRSSKRSESSDMEGHVTPEYPKHHDIEESGRPLLMFQPCQNSCMFLA